MREFPIRIQAIEVREKYLQGGFDSASALKKKATPIEMRASTRVNEMWLQANAFANVMGIVLHRQQRSMSLIDRLDGKRR